LQACSLECAYSNRTSGRKRCMFRYDEESRLPPIAMSGPANATHRRWKFAALAAVAVAVVGFLAGSATDVNGMMAGAGYHSNLYEQSGGEKISQLSVPDVSTDGYACIGSTCSQILSTSESRGGSMTDRVRFNYVVGKYHGEQSCMEASEIMLRRSWPRIHQWH